MPEQEQQQPDGSEFIAKVADAAVGNAYDDPYLMERVQQKVEAYENADLAHEKRVLEPEAYGEYVMEEQALLDKGEQNLTDEETQRLEAIRRIKTKIVSGMMPESGRVQGRDEWQWSNEAGRLGERVEEERLFRREEAEQDRAYEKNRARWLLELQPGLRGLSVERFLDILDEWTELNLGIRRAETELDKKQQALDDFYKRLQADDTISESSASNQLVGESQ